MSNQMIDKTLDAAVVAKNLDAILKKTALERVPRYVAVDGEEVAVIADARWFRDLLAKSEQLDWLLGLPDFGRLRAAYQAAKGRAEAYADEADRIVDSMATTACPVCRKVLQEMAARRAKKGGDLWRRVHAVADAFSPAVASLLEPPAGPSVSTAGYDEE